MRKPSLDTEIKKMVILTDTREQLPYKFPNQRFCKLDYADYTVEYDGKSYLDQIVIERKSNVSELFQATGSSRERWCRELERMKDVPVRFVLCEFSFNDIVNCQPPGILSASAVYGSCIKWHGVDGLPFIFCGNRVNARGYLYKIFYEYVKWKILKAG